MSEKATQQEMQVVFPDHLKGGVYSNLVIITHTREEFIPNFMLVTPLVSAVTARVVISPVNMKRIVPALKLNLEKYEAKFGKLAEVADPLKPRMGFQPSPK